jgi:hypothetical protein
MDHCTVGESWAGKNGRGGAGNQKLNKKGCYCTPDESLNRVSSIRHSSESTDHSAACPRVSSRHQNNIIATANIFMTAFQRIPVLNKRRGSRLMWELRHLSNIFNKSLTPKLKLKSIYDQWSVDNSALVLGSHLEPMTRFVFSVWQLQVSCCGAPSLTRGRISNLFVHLLLGLARADTLGSKSSRT